MSYLIDTNVISELVRAKPEASVVEWFDGMPDSALYLSVLTLGELRKGVERLPDTSRREKLRSWLENDLLNWFGRNLLPIDAAVADRWGRMLAEADRPLPAEDSLLVATALQHDLRLVTRNGKDFQFPGLVVVNPWNA